MSKRRPDKTPRWERYVPIHYLDRPVTLTPTLTLVVLGVCSSVSRGLLHFWERESARRGIDTTDSRKAA
jgi:hypothetical protein